MERNDRGIKERPQYHGFPPQQLFSILVELAGEDTSQPTWGAGTWRGSGNCSSTNWAMLSGYEDADPKQDSD